MRRRRAGRHHHLSTPVVPLAGGNLAADVACEANSVGETAYGKESGDRYVGGSPARYPERYGAVDSARRISKGAPPTLILQGSRDHLVFADRAEAFADKLTKAGVTHRCVELPFLDHDYDYDSRSADNGTKAARALTLPWLQGYAGSARVHDWHRWGGSGPLRFAVGNGARSSGPARPARRWA
ncbi:alpha/beta hydrolase [Streptomyces galilaeus]